MNRVTWCFAACALAGGAGGAWWYFASPHVSRYTPIVAALDAKRLVPNEMGQVDLSRQFPGLVDKDEILVEPRPDGSYAALFPTTRGPGISVIGLVYTSRPFEDGDTFQRPTVMGQNRKRIKIGSYPALLISEKIDDHWYRASYHVE